jgi:hypothetical protein
MKKERNWLNRLFWLLIAAMSQAACSQSEKKAREDGLMTKEQAVAKAAESNRAFNASKTKQCAKWAPLEVKTGATEGKAERWTVVLDDSGCSQIPTLDAFDKIGPKAGGKHATR